MEQKPNGTVILTRAELYEMIWQTPTSQLAKRFGISDVALSKVCKKHNIPKPPLGYWRKVEIGLVPVRPDLPVADDKVQEHITFRSPAEREKHAPIRRSRSVREQIPVPDTLTNPHRLILSTKKALQIGQKWDGILVPSLTIEHLDVRVSKTQQDRAFRIMDTLLKELEARKYRVTAVSKPKYLTQVLVLGEPIYFGIREPTRQTEHIFTKEELRKKEKGLLLWEHKYDHHPSGRLALEILDEDGKVVTKWVDGKEQKVETCLAAFIEGLGKVAERRKMQRAQAEETHRKWEEEQQRRREAEERRKQEQKEIELLRQQVNAWDESQRILAFVAAVERKAAEKGQNADPGSELARWIEWARSYARRIDPLQ